MVVFGLVSVEESSRVLIDLLKRFQEEIGSAIETIEVLQDRKLLESIKQGLEDVKKRSDLRF